MGIVSKDLYFGPRWFLDRMLEAARSQVIIAEPIRNLSSSRFALVRRIARYLTKV